VRVTRLVLGPVETNCWLASDGAGGPLLVIDPAGDPGLLLEAIEDSPVKALVLTHGHFDHMGAVAKLKEVTGAPLLVHRLDADRVGRGGDGAFFGIPTEGVAPDGLFEDGDDVSAGELSLKVLHTPGHTPGSVCLLGDGHLFSGDTLFAGSVGRTDLPDGDSRALVASIREKLVPLADDVVIHPGHGDESTIGRERKRNVFWPRR
jgi:hydroxyacylglutathione hydrolase